MSLTPKYVTETLAAGQVLPVDAYGKHILVVSISASTIHLSIGSDPFEQVIATQHIDCEDRHYSRVQIRNAGGVASTVVLIFSETRVELEGDGGILTAINANLTSINQEISGAAAADPGGQLADTVCPITPGPGVALFAANANRTEVEISSPAKNGAGLVYLGITAARATAADNFKVLQSGESWWSEREKQAIFASSSTGAEVVNGREC